MHKSHPGVSSAKESQTWRRYGTVIPNGDLHMIRDLLCLTVVKYLRLRHWYFDNSKKASVPANQLKQTSVKKICMYKDQCQGSFRSLA